MTKFYPIKILLKFSCGFQLFTDCFIPRSLLFWRDSICIDNHFIITSIEIFYFFILDILSGTKKSSVSFNCRVDRAL